MNDATSCCDDDGNDVSRDDVRDYYSKAALTAQESLCCPTKYQPGDLSHIPQEVLEISYGCGSPVDRTGIKSGEVMVDLGSGGGIDCFIAAKYVGPTGRVFGIDMTEDMLAKARKNSEEVSKNLGYNNLEFKQGFLEAIPMDDQSADLVTSNCVINLSPQKGEVFNEIRRILKPGGRFVIADIISDKEVPQEMRQNKDLWGECVSGALTLNEFLTLAKQSNFHGLSVQKDYLWKEVEGIKFYSYILGGFKQTESNNANKDSSLTAVYSGPFCSVNCDGIKFELGQEIAIDSKTAEKLSTKPFSSHFIITDLESEKPMEADSCCN